MKEITLRSLIHDAQVSTDVMVFRFIFHWWGINKYFNLFTDKETKCSIEFCHLRWDVLKSELTVLCVRNKVKKILTTAVAGSTILIIT